MTSDERDEFLELAQLKIESKKFQYREDLAPSDWADVRRPLETNLTQAQRLAKVFAEGGWAPTVADGGFTHEFRAPSAGPPPWYVYEFTPEDAYAVATKEPGGATRWTF